MAADVTPATWLGAGYTIAAHVVGLTTNDASSNKVLTQLTDAEAATNGDIREVLSAICEAAYQAWKTQVAATNTPVYMQISKSSYDNVATDEKTTTYTFRFTTESTIGSFPAET
jgi:hypothetical protein